ncbi:MAG: hypothetical protein Q9M21_01330 [Mariprofundaceae bacterium]|nr:hypothetical protein [Mariprofundaceae bacterium]
MRSRREQDTLSIYEVFSDMALLMLAAFIFLFAMFLMVSKAQDSGESMKTKAQIEGLEKELASAKARNLELLQEMNTLVGSDSQEQMNKVLTAAGLGQGQGRKDFEMMIQGLRTLPGKDLHLVIDATGSMHGVTAFLIPVLRVIAIRSGKHLSAITWYADNRLGTYSGTMGEMFDYLMQSAPFIGNKETIGHTFDVLTKEAHIPGAYMLIGDEPPTDKIHYHAIQAPVFTLPLGNSDTSTKVEFQKIADISGGRMLELKFR